MIFLVASHAATQAQTTRTSIGGQVSDQYANYNVPSYGYVTRNYENGVWRHYVNGSLLDSDYFGNLKTLNSSATFDLGKIGQFGRIETDQKFALIWQTFRENHSLSTGGKFVPANKANTPAHKLTLYEFAHYVSEARPAITITSMVRCERCSGRRMRTGFTASGAVGEVPCEDCNARGSFAKQENYALIVTGPLPQRPTLAELIKEGLVGVTTAAAPAPPPTLTVYKEPKVVREQTPNDRFRSTRAKAEAGDSQAQYELALFYLQEPEKPVPLDYFEAYNWMLKASMKNHRMAQYHLGRLYENGFGTEKNLESTVQWRRSAALLGCKQSQKWMGQLYTEIFSGNLKYATIIKPDPSNLIEAYAWNNLGSEIPFPLRQDPKTPGPEELESGLVPLNLRDYNFEKSIPTSAARDRDIIARNPLFTKKMYDDAKARCITLAKEAEEHLAQNRPK